MHANGESVDGYGSCLENILNQIDKLGYKTIKNLKFVFHQRGMLQGAYSQHKSLFWIKNQIQNDELHLLKGWDTPNAFFKRMSLVFTNNGVYKDRKMNSLRLVRIELLVVHLVVHLAVPV